MFAPKYAALLVALALPLSACFHSAPPPSHASALLDRPAPEFKRPTLDGSVFDTSTARGKTLVVKFFAKYCEPCKRTLPRVEALHKDHSEIQFVGISEDESENDAREVQNLFGLTFPIIVDRGNVLSGRFRVRDMPITFVISPDGMVKWVGGPDQSDDDLQRALEN